MSYSCYDFLSINVLIRLFLLLCYSASPGFLEKGMSNVKNFIKLNDPRVFENSMNNTPMHRVGKPTELIGAVLYLLSDASTYTTGIDIMIDGGYHVW